MNKKDKIKNSELVEMVIEEARKLRVEHAEAFLDREQELSIEVRDGEVENLKVAQDVGLGVRVIQDNRLGYAYTTDLSQADLIDTLKAALANARAASEDPYYSLPRPMKEYPQLEMGDPELEDVSLEEKIELARQMERVGLSSDPRVSFTEQVTYEDLRFEIAIANTQGLSLTANGSFCGGVASFVAGKDQDLQTGFSLDFVRKFKDLDPEAIGKEAAFKAVRMLGAQRLDTKRVPVVMDPYVVTSFLGMLSSALSAEAVQKGRSLFAGKIGEFVASDQITIIDDGARADGVLSIPFDGEGVPAQETVLLDGGVLQGFLHNSYTAAKDGVSSTGNAMRGSFQSPPQLATTNFYLSPGKSSPEEILRQTKDGFYLTEVMGMHTANPISGDFSLGAAGIWIHNGELTTPVRGMVIAGNILELLAEVDLVGRDLRFFATTGAPTIRVARLTVSGE